MKIIIACLLSVFTTAIYGQTSIDSEKQQLIEAILAPEIKAISDYISHVNGGCGAARDVIDQIMKVKGLWMNDFDAQND